MPNRDRKVHYDTADEAVPMCGQGKNGRHPDQALIASLERDEMALITCLLCRDAVREIWGDLAACEPGERWQEELSGFEAEWLAHDRATQAYWLKHYGWMGKGT